MVATAIYSVTMVLWNETAFPFCRAIVIIIFIPAKAFARDYVITGVGLSVCLSVCLFVTTITK